MSDKTNKVKGCVYPDPIGLLKEIISEMDCRDKVHKYLDSLPKDSSLLGQETTNPFSTN